MAFIVEDGSIVPDANSICSVEFADEYFADRGNETWANLAPESKQFALIKATDYLEITYTYKGSKVSPAQPLLWPRYGILGRAPIPSALLKSCAEYALIAASAALYSNPVYDASGRVVTSETKKLAGMEKTIKYSEFQPAIEKRSYPVADKLVEPLTINNSSVTFITR